MVSIARRGEGDHRSMAAALQSNPPPPPPLLSPSLPPSPSFPFPPVSPLPPSPPPSPPPRPVPSSPARGLLRRARWRLAAAPVPRAAAVAALLRCRVASRRSLCCRPPRVLAALRRSRASCGSAVRLAAPLSAPASVACRRGASAARVSPRRVRLASRRALRGRAPRRPPAPSRAARARAAAAPRARAPPLPAPGARRSPRPPGRAGAPRPLSRPGSARSRRRGASAFEPRLSHAQRVRGTRSKASAPSGNGPGRCGTWGLRVPPRCATVPPGTNAASEGSRLKLTVVRRNEAGHSHSD